MTENASVIALAEPQKVQISQIDKQLNRIWISQTDGTATRASTFNFLIYEREGPEASQIPEAIAEIAIQHPCRAIVLSATEQAPEGGLEALVAAYCPISGGGNPESICCEYITLRAKGEALKDLHTTVASLLLPELETFLWWKGPLTDQIGLFTNLQGIVDRTIVDSALFEAPEQGLERYAAFALNPDRIASFGDLNWARLTPWREETALAFDSEERRACLGGIDRVIIEYGQEAGKVANPSQAYLFLGWLASRLGWQPLSAHTKKELTKQIILRDADQRPIQATVQAVETSPAQSGQLISVGLRSEELGAACSTVLCSADSPSCLRVQMNVGEANISQVSDLDTLTTEQLLTEAMRSLDRDPIFEESLAVIRDLLRLK